ncbi:His Kinase A (phospho-acceptor) domain-containing protein [Clostridium collagenovorans DSM 3089]|uniref:histidine kinase n=1 Tax=Clostridium collagenovorans DSM 3089 TaxID=1121306 RepID=A0A1M5SAS5_9CLOT|nr:HAMP domain-containing sensor histidine kinase [Clostridium collagenovorans]SHH35589.1 His Kinase A (phospho-acceptor) domain-containing protein [Clostridium collagenovorans DSM 3089]
MIKGKKLRLNLVLGVLVGFFIYQFAICEGFAVLVAKHQGTGGLLEIPSKDIVVLRVLALILFGVIILAFNTKKFKKINLNKMSLYLVFSIIVSVIVAIECCVITMSFILRLYPNIDKIMMNNYFLAINSVFLLIFFGVGIFLSIFVMLVNRKVKYIKFITKEVKLIKDEGFGKTIEVKGKDEIAELCESINNMSVELRKKIDHEKNIENAKNELITNVSHDLRTPLTSVIGYVDLLKKNGFEDKKVFDDYISIIDERTKNLNRLINELFEYTKLNNNDIKLNYSNVEIGSLVEQLVGEYIPILNKDGLEVERCIENKDIFIDIDVEKIVRVLENLLINAKKYSVKNTMISVKLFSENDSVIISIGNKTQNICEEDLEKLFERFYKRDKSRNNQDSSGLGLSIVKRIMELHNGDITVGLKEDIIEFKLILPLR